MLTKVREAIHGEEAWQTHIEPRIQKREAI
jgi:hypothetical protein